MGAADFLLIGNPEDSYSQREFRRALEPFGILQIITQREAIEQIMARSFKAIFVDASEIYSFGLLVSRIRGQCPEARVIVLAASPNWESAREAFMSGATDYLQKSSGGDDLRLELAGALTKHVLPWPR